MEYLTFNDLEFKEHENKDLGFDLHAEIEFANGYSLSVINGRSAYCGVDTYEVAILRNGELYYATPISAILYATDDVLSYQTPDDITEVMKQVQDL